MAALEGNREEFDAGFSEAIEEMRDPEGLYYWALMAARAGNADAALNTLRKAVDRGWFCYPAMTGEPWLDVARADPRFSRIVREAEERHRDAAAAFVAAGGDRLLGVRGVS